VNDELRQLGRLKRLREAKERMCEAGVAREVGRLREAEARLKAVVDAEAAAVVEAQHALNDGMRGEWMLALAVREAEAKCQPFLMKVCAECGAAVDAAKKVLRVSRIETEQVSALERELRAVMELEQGRRTQAESDDRFAARGHWRASLRVKLLTEEG
jgi:hypothetical protein